MDSMARVLVPLLLMCSLLAPSVVAQTPRPAPKINVTRSSGGTIRTALSSDIILNKGSSLEREWITVHDSSSPLTLPGTIGITTGYVRERGSGDYYYSAKFAATTTEPLSAVEVRFLLFDVWGNHLRTLSTTEIVDFEGTKEMTGSWRIYSENEVSEYYASIAFVSRARTKEGRVFEASLAPVLEEARKFSRKFSPENLEPKAPKP